MPSCPICKTEVQNKIPEHNLIVYKTPYFDCPNCHAWFQHPMPPKTYIAEFEGDPSVMSDSDRSVNEALADHLFNVVMKGKPGRTLDIGAKLPVLAARLATHGCDASAMDNEKIEHDNLFVNCFIVDFENEDDMAHAGFHGNSLITLIHTFEHLYDPLAALHRLRAMIADDGRVFIRIPQHDVTGYERDLTEGHYQIHPFYHCLTSILEALAQVKDCFVIESMNRMDGFGQADIVLRPITRAPTLTVGVIAKNEERDLPILFDSLVKHDGSTVANRIVLVDTGSTDRTLEIARAYFPHGVATAIFTAASRQDASGDWKLENFSMARNEAILIAEQLENDWFAWFDADDTLATPMQFRRYLYNEDCDVWGVTIQSGGYKWIHHRMFKTAKRLRFKGRCHEYLQMDNCRVGEMRDALIVHNLAPGANQEDSNARNLRILNKEWLEDGANPRTAFYLGNTYKDAGKHELAAHWYQMRCNFGVGFRDEFLFATLYMARSARILKKYDKAERVIASGLKLAPDWAEFYMERAFLEYDQKCYADCIHTCTMAFGLPITPTPLWREEGMYKDQPLRLLSWCHEHLGNIKQAIVWAELAREHISGRDNEWEARIARLKAPPAPAVRTKHDVIALCRPGAIGDILMTLNLIPALKEANPGKRIVYFCSREYGEPDALGGIMRAAGVDDVMDSANWQQWSASCTRAINLVGYPLAEGYPDKPMAKHLLSYFADELGLHGACIPEYPALTLPLPARPKTTWGLPERYATIQITAGWSKYKQWSMEKWRELIELLAMDDGIPIYLIGKDDERYLPFVQYPPHHRTLAQSIALFANATMHIGIDSFCNHLTNFYWQDEHGNGKRVPGVILWGSTQASAAGYASNVNITRDLTCQPCFREDPKISRMDRGACINIVDNLGLPSMAVNYDDPREHRCMAEIEVNEVYAATVELWQSLTVKESA